MNASTKTFLASLIIFACSLGFFIGAFAFNDFGSGDCCKKKMECYMRYNNSPHHNFEHFRGEPPRGPHFEGKDFKGKHFDKKFDKKFDFKKGEAFMDSVLQVTPEQKASLEQQRRVMDSTFKELRKQKKEAEKALREALDANDDKKIATAKANILKAQEALLNHRIQGVKAFNKVLSKEQLEKFKAIQFDHMKHAKPHKGEHGPEHNEQPQD